jgi:RNAse (barnase) inhibitor barstar
MNSLSIDWSAITDYDKFYDYILPLMEAPSWHGRNLDAFHDSWITGGICKSGPPFNFIFRNSDSPKNAYKEFVDTIEEIASESVREHGGSLLREKDNAAEQGAAANP